MPLMFYNGKPLFTADGKLAMSTDCCCECLSSPFIASVEISYSVGNAKVSVTDRVDLLPDASCETIGSYGFNPTYGVAYIPVSGETRTLSTPGTPSNPSVVSWPDDCADSENQPYLSIVAEARTGGVLVVTYSARLVRRGSLSVSFVPNAVSYFTEEPEGSGICKPEGPFYIGYTNDLSIEKTIDGGQAVTSNVNPGWNSNSRTYGNPYSEAFAVQ